MDDNPRFEEIVLAGWLHDIGKFAQRAGREDLKSNMAEQFCPVHDNSWHSHTHVLYTHGTLELLKDSLPDTVHAKTVIELAASHHRPSSVWDHIIAEADRLASGSDRRSELDTQFEKDACFYEKPMVSLLSSIYPNQNKEDAAALREDSHKPNLAYVPLVPLINKPDMQFCTEEKRISQDDYKTHWEGFERDFKALKDTAAQDFMEALDAVLSRWWWCIASSTIDDADISLYQHAKLTASFAGLLYRYHYAEKSLTEVAIQNRSSKKFLFVNGDISGIQSYIFDIKSNDDSTKILRARSFELWALSLILAENLIKAAGGTRADIITTSGGKFMLALPNTQKVRSLLKEKRAEFEKYFLEEFAGKLSIILSEGTEASGEDLIRINVDEDTKSADDYFVGKDVSRLIRQIGMDGEKAKQKKMQQALENTPVLDKLYDELQSHGQCKGCNTFPAQGEDEPCKRCKTLVGIGSELVKAQKIWIKPDPLKPFGKMVSCERRDDAPGALVNDYKVGNPLIWLPYVAPRDSQDNLLCFSDIAQAATGSKKLAMFKADIDNLGFLFSSGFGKKRISFSRYAEMSKLFHFFFSGWFANFIQSNEEYKDRIYVVFSGGDDLCVIGSWDTVMHFACELREALDRFTHNNPFITLSGGIALFSPSTPLPFAAHEAEAELEKSKSYKKGGKLKNALTVFGTTVDWANYKKLLEDGRKLSGWMREGALRQAAVYRLLDFAGRAERLHRGNLRDLMWQSAFRYMHARLEIEGDKKQEIKDWFGALGVCPERIRQSRIAVSYALYAQRKDKE